MVEQTTRGAISPSTGRTLPDRYIEGTCPICGYPEARGDQCDNCGNQLDPTDLIDPRAKINGETPEFVETQHFFLDLPALADALREWLEERRGVGHLAAQRHQVQPQHPRGHPPARDDPRHRLGHPGAARGLARPAHQAALRLVRRGHRLPVGLRRVGPPHRRPRALARVVERPGGGVLLLHGQGQHHLPHPDLAGRAARRTPGGATRAASPGAFGELNLPTEVVSSEYLTMEGKQFSTSRGYVIHVRDVLERYGPDAHPLLHLRRRAGEPGRQLHLGASSSSATTPSSSRAGATSSTARPRWSRRTSARSRSPATLEPVDEAVLAAVLAAVRHRRAACSSGSGRRPRSPRRCGSSARSTSTSPSTEPFKLKGDDQRERLATVLHTLVQCVSDLNTMLAPFLPHAANGVHAVLGGEGEFMPMPRLEEVDRTSTATRPQLPGHHRRVLRDAALGVASGGRRHPVAKPTPVFTKLDESVVEEELARLRGERPTPSERRTADVSPHRSPAGSAHRRRTRCRSRWSTTTPTSTSPATGEHASRRRRGARARPRRRGRPDGPDRLRPARRPVHRRGRRPACRLLGGVALHPNEVPRLAERGGLEAAYAEIERSPPTPGSG